MNRKILIIFICVLLVIVGSTLVFAAFNSKEEVNIGKVKDVGTIDVDNAYVKLESKRSSSDSYLKLGKEHLSNLNIAEKNFTNPTVERYKNNIEDRTEVVISDLNSIVKLDEKTGKLLSYIHKNTQFKKNTLDEATVEKIAIELFNNFKDYENYEEYSLYILEQFDEELYLAKFCRKYGKYTNPGEMICFGFSPEEKEIVNIVNKLIPFADNEIKISIDEVRSIALPYLEASVATDMNIEMKIVEPNYGLLPALKNNHVHTRVKETRLAYVCEFNNEDKTTVYIDCTTGMAIGADFIAGGTF